MTPKYYKTFNLIKIPNFNNNKNHSLRKFYFTNELYTISSNPEKNVKS